MFCMDTKSESLGQSDLSVWFRAAVVTPTYDDGSSERKHFFESLLCRSSVNSLWEG